MERLGPGFGRELADQALRMRGDPQQYVLQVVEGRDVDQLAALNKRIEERSRVYQYFLKRQAPPIIAAGCASPVIDQAVRARAAHLNGRAGELFEMDLFLVLMYEGLGAETRMATWVERALRSPRAALRDWLSPGAVIKLLEEDVTRAVAQLHQQARALEVHLADTVRPVRLSKEETFRFFRRLVNYDPAIAAAASLRA